MSDKWLVNVGKTWTYQTRPAGYGATYLYLQPYSDDNGVSDDTSCTWRIELSNQDDNLVPIKQTDSTKKVDISRWPGALVDIRNSGGWPFYAWTDY